MNGYGKLRRCTDRDAKVVDFYLYLAAAFVTVRQLIQRARKRYRCPGYPAGRPGPATAVRRGEDAGGCHCGEYRRIRPRE
jgi:hypothetical protein